MTVKFQVKISLQVRMKVMSVHPSKLQDPKQLHLVADLGKPISLEEISDLKARRLGRWFQRLELMERSDKTLNKLMHDIIGDIDDNGDGEISFQEFCKMMRKILE